MELKQNYKKESIPTYAPKQVLRYLRMKLLVAARLHSDTDIN